METKTDNRGVEYVERGARLDHLPAGWMLCGNCGRAWNDAKPTSVTPVPSGRCPFEYEHEDSEPAEPLAGAHERGFESGYSAAIHDARIAGSRAHAELYGESAEPLAARAAALAADIEDVLLRYAGDAGDRETLERVAEDLAALAG